MIRLSQVFLTLLFFADLLSLVFAWVFAYWVRFYAFPLPPVAQVPPFADYCKALPWLVGLGAIAFLSQGMYKNLMRQGHQTWLILKACVALYVLLLGLGFFYRGVTFSRAFALHFFWMAPLALGMVRYGAWQVLATVRKRGKNLVHVLVIGQGATAQRFVQQIQSNPGLGMKLHGLVGKLPGVGLLGLPWLGGYGQIHEVIEQEGIQQIYIALDSADQSDLDAINHELASTYVDLYNVPDIYHGLNINPQILDLEGIPVVALRQSPLSGWNSAVKRGFDLVGAVAALLLLIPCWLVLPLLIKLTSPGPVFYRQERMGLDGKRFFMWKFRSMRVDAEDQTGAVWATKGDDRTTQLGAFMRKTSLDELPQFFNVLKGDMSLVGPRPERPVFIEEFKKSIPNYMARHKMKAGITGWAQVNGWRGNTSLEKRIECDIYYLTHWSIWLDIQILLLTLIRGFVNPNAY